MTTATAPADPTPRHAGARRRAAPRGSADTARGPRPAPPPVDPAPVTGAQSLVRSLEEVGGEVVFGIPGGAILPAYDPLLDSTRSGTSWSATSRARATPPPATRRPPAGSASAWRPRAPARPTWSPRSPTRTWTRCRWSRSPARSAAALIGTDAFQEADICGITMPITKHNFLVTDPADIPQTIAEAFHLASTGRPGPVLVDIPKDVLQAQTTFSLAAGDCTCPATGRRPGRTASRSARPPS